MPGAGLYEVGPGKPYSTIQSALDQLWSDQGGATFTENQIIRVFAGTYAENVAPNSGLRPDYDDGYLLILEGDPNDDRANIVVEPASGRALYLGGCTQMLVRNMTLRATNDSVIYVHYGVQLFELDNCVVQNTLASATGTVCYTSGAARFRAQDCIFRSYNNIGPSSTGILSLADASHLKRCIFEERGSKTNQYGVVVDDRKEAYFEACVFYRLEKWAWYTTRPWSYLRVANCTFCGGSVLPVIGAGPTILLDNIVHKPSGGPAIHVYGPWPNESATQRSGDVLMRNNCFYGHTEAQFACHFPTTTYKTYAEFIALNRVDEDASIFEDPKFVDPANGDYSLAVDSPCRSAGTGSGAHAGYNGVAFDGFHPDIGAWSSGERSPPARPAAELEKVESGRITVDLDGDDGAENVVDLFAARTGELVGSASRQGDGPVVLDVPEPSARYVLAAWSRNGAGASPPAAPLEVFVPGPEGPFEEVRAAIVARLSEHAGLAELLGLDESGAVPIYASGSPAARRIPCLVYTLNGWPDASMDRPGRWKFALALEARGGSTAANDLAVSAADEVLHASPFECVSWSVKRIARTGDETLLEGDARTEVRRTAWSLVVDRRGG